MRTHPSVFGWCSSFAIIIVYFGCGRRWAWARVTEGVGLGLDDHLVGGLADDARGRVAEEAGHDQHGAHARSAHGHPNHGPVLSARRHQTASHEVGAVRRESLSVVVVVVVVVEMGEW
jgi:hypothetical protein